MKYNTIKTVGESNFVHMGPIRLRQPIPTMQIPHVDPFILLHHYGPYTINESHNPFDLGPHPHRGFEPITFLIEGEQLHRDSLGNESVVTSGDVQWTTAGRGVIHSEGPTKSFVSKGGVLEGIQLWLNLPAKKKMIPAKYQHVKSDEFEVVTSNNGLAAVKVVAGTLHDAKGKIETETEVNAYLIHLEEDNVLTLPIAERHQALLYLMHGSVVINEKQDLKEEQQQLLVFNQDGEGISIKAKQKSSLLFLSAIPFNEPIASWGPYVMNTQTEIMEALRDYQQGKMGYLSRD